MPELSVCLFISPRRSTDVAKMVRESAVTFGRPKVDKMALLEKVEAEKGADIVDLNS